MNEGFDVVSGWRSKRKDTAFKKFVSSGAKFLRNTLIHDPIHDSGCTLKSYKKECFDELDLYGEIHRFSPAILSWRGFKIGEAKVEHRARTSGKTKYNWKRILKGFVDMISVWFWRKFSSRPLHLFGGFGILIGGADTFLALYLAIARLIFNYSLQDKIWPMVSIFMILAGLQFFISGLLADIAVKTYYNGKKKVYNIEKIIKN